MTVLLKELRKQLLKDNSEIKSLDELKREIEKLSPEEKKIAKKVAELAQKHINLSKKLSPKFDENDLD